MLWRPPPANADRKMPGIFAKSTKVCFSLGLSTGECDGALLLQSITCCEGGFVRSNPDGTAFGVGGKMHVAGD